MAVFCLRQGLAAVLTWIGFCCVPMGPGASPVPAWLLGLARWDGAWYLGIAEHGYTLRGTAFFPLYPMLIRLLSAATGLPPAYAGLLLANLCFLGALVVVYRYALSLVPRPAARLATLLLACFPTSLFFGALYSESLYLLLSTLALFALRRRRHVWAAGAAYLAALCRPQGICLAAAALLAAVRHRKDNVQGVRDVGVAAACALGMMTYMAFLAWRFGDPESFVVAAGFWGRTSVVPGSQLPMLVRRLLAGTMNANVTLMVSLNLFVALLVALSATRARAADGEALAYVATYLLMTLSADIPTLPLQSFARYAMVLVPVYIWWAPALLARPVVRVAVLVPSAALAILLQLMFVAGYWVT